MYFRKIIDVIIAVGKDWPYATIPPIKNQNKNKIQTAQLDLFSDEVETNETE